MPHSAKPRTSRYAKAHHDVKRFRFLRTQVPERPVPIIRFPIETVLVITKSGRIVRIAKKK